MIRRLIRSLLLRLSSKMATVAKRIYLYPQEERVIPWLRDEGDKTLRLDYELNEDSVVFDLGGYKGQWSSDIFSKYRCSIHVFEPVVEFAVRIESRFRKNPKIQVHRFGLASQTRICKISIKGDRSSILDEDGEMRDIKLIRAEDFIADGHFEHIALMKVNIEGAEYELLEHLIHTGLIRMIDNLQVQFHDIDANSYSRMKRIQESLAVTHELTYQCLFVWENWRL